MINYSCESPSVGDKIILIERDGIQTIFHFDSGKRLTVKMIETECY